MGQAYGGPYSPELYIRGQAYGGGIQPRALHEGRRGEVAYIQVLRSPGQAWVCNLTSCKTEILKTGPKLHLSSIPIGLTTCPGMPAFALMIICSVR